MVNCGSITLNPFTIGGTVQAPAGTAVGSALVKLMKGATIVKYVYTASNGSYTLTDVKPDTYTVVVTKTGYTFPTSAP